MKAVFSLFTTYKGFYLYDRNKNSILQISEFEYMQLVKHKRSEIDDDVIAVFEGFQKQGYLLPHVVNEIKHFATDSMRDYLSRKIEKITLQVTQNCNLRCDYCVYSGSYPNRTHGNKRMNFETAKKCIDYLFANSSEKEKVNIGFYGGEPLLELSLIRQCVEYIESEYSDKQYDYAITTNGTLLDEDTARYLFDKNFMVMISMDGPREIHNMHRKYANGSGSFDDIIKNMERINQLFPERKGQIMVNTVVSPNNQFSCLVDFYSTDAILENYNPKYSLISDYASKDYAQYDEQFNIVSQKERMKALLWSINKLPRSYVSTLFTGIRGELLNAAKQLTYIEEFPKIAHPGGPCIAGLKRLFSDVDGVFYPCERLSETSLVTRIGTIDKGIDIERASIITNIAKLTEEECKDCWAFMHCAMCVAMADGGNCLSRTLKLSKCETVKMDAISKFRDYCFCVEHGVDFEDFDGGEDE